MTQAREEAAGISWNGLSLRLASRLVPRFAWQTASIELAIDDMTVLQTGGAFKFVGAVVQSFEVQGALHEARLEWGRGTLKSFPCKVTIDGLDAWSGRVRVGNWWIGLWPWIALVALLAWSALR